MVHLKQYLREGLHAGALGLFAGGTFPPSCYSDLEEIGELVQEVAAFGGICQLSPSCEADDAESVGGLCELAARYDCTAHIAGLATPCNTHHQTAQPRTSSAIEYLELAKLEGRTISGSLALHAPAVQPLEAVAEGLYHGLAPENVIIVAAPKESGWEGKSLGAVAQAMQCTSAYAVQEMLAAGQEQVRVLPRSPVMRELQHQAMRDDKDAFLFIASERDSGYRSTSIPESDFLSLLSSNSLQESGLALEEVVNRMTSRPATAYKLNAKGLIAPGCFADLVLFDQAKLDAGGSAEHVFVNGKQVLQHGQCTGALPGHVITSRK